MSLTNDDLAAVLAFMNSLQEYQSELEEGSRLVVTKLDVELSDEDSLDTEANISFDGADNMLYLTT